MSGVSQWKGGLLLLVLASALWGAWTAAEKYSLGGLPVVTVLGLTLVAAAGLLWAVLLRQGHTRPTREQLRLLAVLGLLEPTIGYGAIGLGLVHVEAAEAALLSGTEACWVVMLASIVSRRLPTGGAVAGVLLAAVGVAVLGGAHDGFGLGKGDILVLVGAVAAATATIIAGRTSSTVIPARMRRVPGSRSNPRSPTRNGSATANSTRAHPPPPNPAPQPRPLPRHGDISG